jgi:hypothetical protein
VTQDLGIGRILWNDLGNGKRIQDLEHDMLGVSENLKGRDHLEDQNVDGKRILEKILGNMVGGCGLDACLRIGTRSCLL